MLDPDVLVTLPGPTPHRRLQVLDFGAWAAWFIKPFLSGGLGRATPTVTENGLFSEPRSLMTRQNRDRLTNALP
jgi:hypothetical protein